jgi:hypothetical protein
MAEEGLFGTLPPTAGTYTVFQDESGVSSSERWLVLGFLFVPTAAVATLTSVLGKTKAECGCNYEVHFSAIPKALGGAYGLRGRAASRWMREYGSNWHRNAEFTVLAVDTRALHANSFPTRFYMQNRFCVMALKCGIACHIVPQGFSQLDLRIIYDRHDLPGKTKTGFEDNYDAYVGPHLVEAIAASGMTSGGHRYPSITVSSVEGADSHDCLPLQLTDLLLGAVNQAITQGSAQLVKAGLGLAATHWCMDVSKSPWLQQLGMYRHLCLKAFPDEDGQMYDLANVIDERSRDDTLFPA